MSARRILWGATVALTFAAAVANAVPLATARSLAAQLVAGRRAEATVEYTLSDPLGGPARLVRGRVAVENPDRVRLDFATTGERIALRRDGGEWLQPAARQLVRIPAERAEAALLWWRVLLPNSGDSFREDSLAPRRFRLTPIAAATESTPIEITLDTRGMPAQVSVAGLGDSPTVYRFSGWRFGAARGANGYRITAPAGFEVVDLP